jgi:hypothetical protein
MRRIGQVRILATRVELAVWQVKFCTAPSRRSKSLRYDNAVGWPAEFGLRMSTPIALAAICSTLPSVGAALAPISLQRDFQNTALRAHNFCTAKSTLGIEFARTAQLRAGGPGHIEPEEAAIRGFVPSK